MWGPQGPITLPWKANCPTLPISAEPHACRPLGPADGSWLGPEPCLASLLASPHALSRVQGPLAKHPPCLPNLWPHSTVPTRTSGMLPLGLWSGRTPAQGQTTFLGSVTMAWSRETDSGGRSSNSVDGTQFACVCCPSAHLMFSTCISLIADKIGPCSYVHMLSASWPPSFGSKCFPHLLVPVGCSVFLSLVCRDSLPHSYL